MRRLEIKFSFLICLLCSYDAFAVNEKEDFVYDLSLATQGISVSQYNTGVNYSIGRGIEKNLEKAVYWYQRASEQGHSKAPFNIAIIYTDGVGLVPNPELGLKYFLMAEKRNNWAAKKFLNGLRSYKEISMEAALLKYCCPSPLSHSMIEKK
jgi:TPR repeat protein